MRVVLSAAGFTVEVAQGGIKALLVIKAAAPIDLVVTDILMPDGDGIDLILALRKSVHRPMILAVSGGGMLPSAEYLESAAMLGADGVLAKPFSGAQLLAKVREVLGMTRRPGSDVNVNLNLTPT